MAISGWIKTSLLNYHFLYTYRQQLLYYFHLLTSIFIHWSTLFPTMSNSMKPKRNNCASLLNPHICSMHIAHNKYWWHRFTNPKGIFLTFNGNPVLHSVFMSVAVFYISTYCLEKHTTLKWNLPREGVHYVKVKLFLFLVNT